MGRGASVPWKCCKVFCALVVTVKRSVDQLFMHYFHIFCRLHLWTPLGGLSPGPLICPSPEKILWALMPSSNLIKSIVVMSATCDTCLRSLGLEYQLRLGRQRQMYARCAGKTVRFLENACHTWAPWRCVYDKALYKSTITFTFTFRSNRPEIGSWHLVSVQWKELLKTSSDLQIIIFFFYRKLGHWI